MNLLQKRQWTGICRFSPCCFCHIYMCSFKTKMENINFEETSGLGLMRKYKSENSLMERQCVSVQGKRTKHRPSVRRATQRFLQIRKRCRLLPGVTALSQGAACLACKVDSCGPLARHPCTRPSSTSVCGDLVLKESKVCPLLSDSVNKELYNCK